MSTWFWHLSDMQRSAVPEFLFVYCAWSNPVFQEKFVHHWCRMSWLLLDCKFLWRLTTAHSGLYRHYIWSSIIFFFFDKVSIRAVTHFKSWTICCGRNVARVYIKQSRYNSMFHSHCLFAWDIVHPGHLTWWFVSWYLSKYKGLIELTSISVLSFSHRKIWDTKVSDPSTR